MKNSSSTKNVHNTIVSSIRVLEKARIASPRLDSLVLLGHVLGKSKHWLLVHPEFELSGSDIATLDAFLKRRADHESVAYIIGVKEFYGRDFAVSKSVLVPRPETEDLITLALGLEQTTQKIIDIGTGSGVIGITLKLERPQWTVVLTDTSLAALEVAKQNAENHNVSNDIVFSKQNLLHNDHSSYDLIIANLPYVPLSLSAKPDLVAEPSGALFSRGDGLDHYREFFGQLSTRKHPVPTVITESLQSQHAVLEKIAHESGYTLHATLGLAQLFVRG